MTQRPDLFGACLPAVGVMDMLRFHKFTAGRFWVDDYGSSDDAEEFKALLRLFAVSQPQKGHEVSGDAGDDRPTPTTAWCRATASSSSAELQYCQGGPAPVLVRIETRAGHGAGKPTAKHHRGSGRPVGVSGEEFGDEGEVTFLSGLP